MYAGQYFEARTSSISFHYFHEPNAQDGLRAGTRLLTSSRNLNSVVTRPISTRSLVNISTNAMNFTQFDEEDRNFINVM